jgi:hypothetical protein
VLPPTGVPSGASDGSLLIVQHGAGRGRLHGFRQHVLDDMSRRRPVLFARTRVHETGQPLPRLDRVRAVIFWLADPLRELYPEDYAEASEIARRAEAAGARIINPPDTLSNTIKSVQARLWQQAGIPCAPCEAFRDRAELEAVIARTAFPAIVRTDLHHAQEQTYVCATAEQALKVPVEGRLYPGVVLSFIDTRAGYEAARPGTIWARSFHKKRSFIYGDVVVPNHTLFADSPVVGLNRSVFRRYKGNRAVLSPLAHLRRWHRDALDVDRAFAEAAPEHRELFVRANRALGLDFGAVDYSTLADGAIVLWEINPYFSMPVGNKGFLAGPRRLAARNRRNYDAMETYFEGLIAG